MGIHVFLDRGLDRRVRPYKPDTYYVEDFNAYSGVPVTSGTIGERTSVYGTNYVHTFAESPGKPKKPVRMTPGARSRLIKRLHEAGVHGEYESLSDGGLVSLAHARRASKNADAEAAKHKPRLDIGNASGSDSDETPTNTPPASSSTQVPKAPSPVWRHRDSTTRKMSQLAAALNKTRLRDSWGRTSTATL